MAKWRTKRNASRRAGMHIVFDHVEQAVEGVYPLDKLVFETIAVPVASLVLQESKHHDGSGSPAPYTITCGAESWDVTQATFEEVLALLAAPTMVSMV